MSKEFCRDDLIQLWEKGFSKSPEEVEGFSQYKIPSGINYKATKLLKPIQTLFFQSWPGSIRVVYNLVNPVLLSDFVQDPYFSFEKKVKGDTATYNCKVLDLHTLPEAKAGDEVVIYVRYTHREVQLKQIDDWLSLYGELKTQSR